MWVRMNVQHVCRCLWRLNESIQSHRSWTRDGPEPSCGFWKQRHLSSIRATIALKNWANFLALKYYHVILSAMQLVVSSYALINCPHLYQMRHNCLWSSILTTFSTMKNHDSEIYPWSSLCYLMCLLAHSEKAIRHLNRLLFQLSTLFEELRKITNLLSQQCLSHIWLFFMVGFLPGIIILPSKEKS